MKWLAAFVSLVLPMVASADPALDKILECMRANIPPTVRIQTVEVTAFDRTGGERTMRGRLFGMREDGKVRVMLHIDAPVDLAGAAYLVRESQPSDEMYLFLPSVNRVRRITGAALDGQLWGTDLSYNDFKQIQNAFSGSDVVREADSQFEQKPTYVVSFKPSKEDASRYNRIRAQVEQKSCVAVSVEFLDPSGVRKTVTVHPKDLKQSGTRWYASEATVADVKNLTHTRIKVIGVEASDKLANRYFNPQTFYLGN
jgi:hypothetical protein